MKYKIIVLDLDGTLTNSKKEISKDTLDALLKIQQLGFKVALASGRPTPGIRKLAKELALEKYGGYIAVREDFAVKVRRHVARLFIIAKDFSRCKVFDRLVSV